MSDNSEKTSVSIEDGLSIAAIMLRKSKKELVALTEGKDLSTTESLLEALKDIAIDDRNALIKAQVSKGYKNAKKDSEANLRKLYPNLDLEGKTEAEIVEAIEAIPSVDNDSKKTITPEQAFALPQVQERIKKLEEKATQYDTKVSEFESYKTNQKLMKHAVQVLESEGANFSSNPAIKARQIKALETELTKHKYSFDDDGTPIPLDDEGQHPRYNKNDGSNWGFKDWAKTFSPVDFGAVEQPKADGGVYVPPNPNNNNSNHGFSESQLSKLGANDYTDALKSGETAKADFIKEQMYKNTEALKKQ